jgi:hypothetical protein
MGPQTPEFVAYAIAQECALRGGKNPWHPLQAERQLRPLREFCKARAAGWLRGGICWNPAEVCDEIDGLGVPYGFAAGPMLDAYGGEEWVEERCRGCPACAIRFPDAPPIAGCFGQIVSDPSLHARFDDLLARRHDADSLRCLFLDTRPRWYGVWSHSPLTMAQQQAHLSIFSEFEILHADSQYRHWCDTLRYAMAAGLPVHVLLVPPGMVQGRTWTVNASCGRCGAGRDALARSCSSCGTPGFFIPPRRRLAMGRRPYRDLRAEYSVAQLRELLSQQPE